MTGVAGTGAAVGVPNSSNSLRLRGGGARTRPAPPRVEESGARAAREAWLSICRARPAMLRSEVAAIVSLARAAVRDFGGTGTGATSAASAIAVEAAFTRRSVA